MQLPCMPPSTRLSKGEDPLPLILLKESKNGWYFDFDQSYIMSSLQRVKEWCTGDEASNTRHSPVTPGDLAFPSKYGNPSGFDSSFSQETSPDTKKVEEKFGQDTAAKSVAYASDEIYIENMWGELRKATPPPSGQSHFHESTARVDKKLKGAPQTLQGRT